MKRLLVDYALIDITAVDFEPGVMWVGLRKSKELKSIYTHSQAAFSHPV